MKLTAGKHSSADHAREAVRRIAELVEQGRVSEASALASAELAVGGSPDVTQLRTLRAVAVFEQGCSKEAIGELRESLAGLPDGPEAFSTLLALFSRESQFQSPAEALPLLSQLRQAAAAIGNHAALSGLHLAVARLEAYRGRCIDARRHLEIARSAHVDGAKPIMAAAIALVDASLESTAGNLRRARESANTCVDVSTAFGFRHLRAGALTNLGLLSLCQLESDRARATLAMAVAETEQFAFIRLAALDNQLQLALHEDDLDACDELQEACDRTLAEHKVPSRSWYDLAHQVTRCSVMVHLEDWEGVIALAESLDSELERRQFQSLRTSVLSDVAKAWAQLGEHTRAHSTLASAMASCPKGAVESQIHVEWATGHCLVEGRETDQGTAYFDRALAAARSVGHRLLEQRISRDRARSLGTCSKRVGFQAGPTTVEGHTLVDAAALISGRNSVDLVLHHALALLERTGLRERTSVQDTSGEEHSPRLMVSSGVNAAGDFEIELRGSDRKIVVCVSDASSVHDVAVTRSLSDILMAAAHSQPEHWHSPGVDLWPVHSGDEDEIILGSPRMLEVLRVATRLAASNLPILITGETGTGKDVFARIVHRHSLHSRGPFVPFNCSSVPRDLMESQLFGHRRGAFTGAVEHQGGVIKSAEDGTLFLDEVADMNLQLQPKLLRFLETGEIHAVGEARPRRIRVRIISATNADLSRLSDSGEFRKDLFYRLGAAQIVLPPLRDRKDEIPALTSLFLRRFAEECQKTHLRASDDLIAALLLYDWPGNIRQLGHELHRMVAMAEPGQTLTSADLSSTITAGWTVQPSDSGAHARSLRLSLDQTLPQAIEAVERAFVTRALQATGGRVHEAAQLLGISRKGLFLKRRRWGQLTEDDDEESGPGGG